VEFLMSVLLLLTSLTFSSKTVNSSSNSGRHSPGQYTQTSPPPMCDPTTQNCGN